MKKSVCLLLSLFLSACSLSMGKPPLKAVYLVQEGGQLPQADLDKYPEILVTKDFDVFRQAARHKIALWIDKNASQLIPADWITTPPQEYYPIVVVGYNDPLRAFKYNLQTNCFLGPINPDFSGSEPGFSVFQEQPENTTACGIAQGYKLTPTLCWTAHLYKPFPQSSLPSHRELSRVLERDVHL